MKLVVLSDLHLVAEGETCAGLDPAARLGAAIDRINCAHPDADLVVLAGDLADRGEPAAYELLQERLDRLAVPWALTLGNHDDRDALRAVFGSGYGDPNGFVQSAHQIDGHRVIVLDTLTKGPSPKGNWGLGHGSLCPDRLAWLDAELGAAGEAPVIVAMHHPTVPAAIQMDAYGLADPGPFIDRLSRASDVRAVISGHIHMATTSFHRGIPFTTIAGGHSTSLEDFGWTTNKHRAAGPAQMAVVLSGPETTTIHFDNYVDANPDLGETA